jgi:hypothetical protein
VNSGLNGSLNDGASVALGETALTATTATPTRNTGLGYQVICPSENQDQQQCESTQLGEPQNTDSVHP